jgi:hypothetical protein
MQHHRCVSSLTPGQTCDGEVRQSFLRGGYRADVLLDGPDGLHPQHQHLPALADAVRPRLGLQVDLRMRASLLKASASLAEQSRLAAPMRFSSSQYLSVEVGVIEYDRVRSL